MGRGFAGFHPESADVDDNGVVDILDAVRLLNYIESVGPPPEEPFLKCGPDCTLDWLPDCEENRPCYY